MFQRHYIDALGSKLPPLERNLLKLRAFEMLLVLFYAEELKRWLLDHANANHLTGSRPSKSASTTTPRKALENWRNALEALHLDGAFSTEQKAEVIRLIKYRNDIGHEIHRLLADLSADRGARNRALFSEDDQKQYDDRAILRFKRVSQQIKDINRTGRYIIVVGFNGIQFRSAERTFQNEIEALKKKITKLTSLRVEKIEELNSEMSATLAKFSGEMSPGHPLNQFDDRRLTKRGQEICYRLFDDGKSEMAVAHLMAFSIRAARRRKRMWTALGGESRVKEDPLSFPNRRSRANCD